MGYAPTFANQGVAMKTRKFRIPMLSHHNGSKRTEHLVFADVLLRLYGQGACKLGISRTP